MKVYIFIEIGDVNFTTHFLRKFIYARYHCLAWETLDHMAEADSVDVQAGAASEGAEVVVTLDDLSDAQRRCLIRSAQSAERTAKSRSNLQVINLCIAAIASSRMKAEIREADQAEFLQSS